MSAIVSPAAGIPARRRRRPVASWGTLRTDVRQLILLLVGFSIADVATTGLALSWGGDEKSPGGMVALAVLGLPGLVVLKIAALGLVRWLWRRWRTVGAGVGWGLTVLTVSAVLSNLSLLAGAYASVR